MSFWKWVFAVVAGILLSACGGGGGDDAGPATLGVFSIRTAGGMGGLQGGYGGNGGWITAIKEGGSGDLRVVRSGIVDASFTPGDISVNLGANPLIITTDTVISVVTTVPPAGTPYLLTNSDSLYISDGDKLTGSRPPVTGLRVADGATVTFVQNALAWSRLRLAGDVENHGTITTADVSPLQRGHLELSCGRYTGSGIIDTGGRGLGQNGGNIFLKATSTIHQKGRISTVGAATEGGLAGAGGDVELYSRGALENTGPIDTAGGTAVSGTGGRGGYIDLVGYHALSNTGRLNSTGGTGAAGGGDGGGIWLEVYTEGDLRSTGELVSSGGASSGGNGGHGGEVDIYAYGGSIRHNASVHTAGGDSQSGHGGQGGYIIYGTFQGWNVATEPGDILVSGNLTTTGGSAGPTGDGGNGGTIDFYLGNFAEANPALEKNQRLALLGYQSLDTRGGDGNFGGSGGQVHLLGDHGYVNPGVLTNEAEIFSRGGNVAPGANIKSAHGGKGGDVYLETYADPLNAANSKGTKLSNVGRIDAAGGEGWGANGTYWWAGGAGEVFLYGAQALTNSGQIVARGGNDNSNNGGGTGFGGEGNWITLMADGPLVNSGRIDAGGGYGEYRGGSAGEIYLLGRQSLSNSGDIYARGGDARTSLFGSLGGDGGWVDIGLLGRTGKVTNTGSVFVRGGAGSTPGFDGSASID
jgi:hypothetical protein